MATSESASILAVAADPIAVADLNPLGPCSLCECAFMSEPLSSSPDQSLNCRWSFGQKYQNTENGYPPRGQLKRCGKCQQVAYCSRECQRRDWPRHKIDCVRLCAKPAGPDFSSIPTANVPQLMGMLRAMRSHDIAHGDTRQSFLHPYFRPFVYAIGKRLLEFGGGNVIDDFIAHAFGPSKKVKTIEELKSSIDRMHLNCVWDGIGMGGGF